MACKHADCHLIEVDLDPGNPHCQGLVIECDDCKATATISLNIAELVRKAPGAADNISEVVRKAVGAADWEADDDATD